MMQQPKLKTKSCYVPFRLHKNEKDMLEDLCKQAGVNRSELLRRLLQSGQCNVKLINTDKLLNTLNNLSAEQGRVNNNINQLARHANQYSKVADLNQNVFKEFNQLFSKHLEYQDQIAKSLKGIYKEIR